MREDQELEIGIGLETADDFIRKICLNKGFSRTEFEAAVNHIGSLPPEKSKRISVTAYILVKPPWLTEAEAINDVIETIEYLSDLSSVSGISIIPKLEPAVISQGTLLSLLWEAGEYKPMNYWMLLEILTRLHFHKKCSSSLRSVRIGSRNDMDDSTKIPAIYGEENRIDKYDFVLYGALQAFNYHRDLLQIFTLLIEVYKKNNVSLMHYSQSLRKWIGTNFPDGDSNILKYLETNQNQFDDTILSAALTDEIQYIAIIFKILDIIEGYFDEGDSFLDLAAEWKKRLAEVKSVNDQNVIVGDIQSKINRLLHTRLKYSQIYVDEVYTESKESELLRLMMRVTDLLRIRTYEIWAGIPTK